MKLILPKNSFIKTRINEIDFENKSFTKFYIVDIPEFQYKEHKIFQKLMNYPSNNKIFINEAISSMIKFQWNNFAKPIYKVKLVIFLIFLVAATYNTIFLLTDRFKEIEIIQKLIKSHGITKPTPKIEELTSTSKYFDYCFLSYSTLLILYEIISIWFLKGFKRYFSDFWNYIDFIVACLIISTSVIDINNSADIYKKKKLIKTMHSITIYLIFLRLLSYIRIFDKLSFFLRAFLQSIADIRAFLIVALILLIGLSLSSKLYFIYLNLLNFFKVFTLQDVPYKKIKLDILKIAYRILLGDFDDIILDPVTKEYTKDQQDLIFIIFFFNTILLVIVLLNLIIAIVSDTYANVKNNEDVANNYEKASIISDIHSEMFKFQEKILRKRKNFEKYLLIIKFSPKHEQSYSSSEEINLDKKFENLENKINNSYILNEQFQIRVFKEIENMKKEFLKFNNNIDKIK